MPKRLDDLYHSFYKPKEFMELKNSIEENHKILINHPSKEDKKPFCELLMPKKRFATIGTRQVLLVASSLAYNLRQNYKIIMTTVMRKTNSMTVVNFLCRKENRMMKKKAKVILAGATALIITSLLIISPQHQPLQEPTAPNVRPVSALVETDRDTPPTEYKAVVGEEIPDISNHSKEIVEQASSDTPPTQPTDKKESSNTPTEPQQQLQSRLYLSNHNPPDHKWAIPVW